MSLAPTDLATSQETLSALESIQCHALQTLLYCNISVVNTVSIVSASPELPSLVGIASVRLVPRDSRILELEGIIATDTF